MKNSLVLFLVGLTMLTVSCSDGEMSTEDMYEKYSSGVVMILNQYYYQITLSDSTRLYFSGIDDNENLKDLTTREDSIQANCATMSGSGFFIGDKGEILTNSHVIDPDIEIRKVKLEIKDLIAGLGHYLTDVVSNLEAENKANPQPDMAQRIKGLDEFRKKVEANDANDIKVTTINSIDILLQEKTKNDSLSVHSCTLIKKDKYYDLAVIQLEDQMTPAKTHIFKMAGYKGYKDESIIDKVENFFGKKKKLGAKLKLGQQLYMIGYNKGLDIGNTPDGLNPQITTGYICQFPDVFHVMYTCPGIEGSSGSPVLDKSGNIVAVQFAYMRQTDSFNMGIKLIQVNEFLEGIK